MFVFPRCLAKPLTCPGPWVCGAHGGRTATLHPRSLILTTLPDTPTGLNIASFDKEVFLLCLAFEDPPARAEHPGGCVYSDTLWLLGRGVSRGQDGDRPTGRGLVRGNPQVWIISVLAIMPIPTVPIC